MIFANKTAAEIWVENHCDRCFEPDQAEKRLTGRGRGCMILNAALTRKTPPPEITKGRNGSLMADAFKCSSFAAKPPSTMPSRMSAYEDEPSLFDADFHTGQVFMDGDHA